MPAWKSWIGRSGLPAGKVLPEVINNIILKLKGRNRAPLFGYILVGFSFTRITAQITCVFRSSTNPPERWHVQSVHSSQTYFNTSLKPPELRWIKKKNYILNTESLPSSLQALLLKTDCFQDKTKIRLRSTLDALFAFSKQSHLTRSSSSGVEPHCFLCRRLLAQVSAGVPLSLSWRWRKSDREDPRPRPPHEAFHFPNVHAGPLRFIWG